MSAAPAGAAISIRWHAPAQLEPASYGGLTGVSCAGALCVAVDGTGNALTTTNAGASTWSKPFKIDALVGGGLTAVSCPTTKLCVAVDALGNVMTSVNPTGGKSAWSKPVKIDSTTIIGGAFAGLADVSCPTVSLCVAVDSGSPGNVVASTNPTGGASAWHLDKKVGTLLTSISCPTSSLCVAAGAQHYVSTNPGSIAAAWHATGPQRPANGPSTGDGAFNDVACPSTALCVGVGFGSYSPGLASTTTTPRGSAATWTTVTLQPTPPNPGAGVIDSVACISSAFCAAVDSNDNVFTSTAPATGVWSAQTPVGLASAAPATNSAVSCVSTGCVVVDSNGYAIAGGRHG